MDETNEEGKEESGARFLDAAAEGEASTRGNGYPKGFLLAVEHPELILPPSQWSMTTKRLLRALHASLLQQWTASSSSSSSSVAFGSPWHRADTNPFLPTHGHESPEIVFIGADGYPVDLPEDPTEACAAATTTSASPFSISQAVPDIIASPGRQTNGTEAFLARRAKREPPAGLSRATHHQPALFPSPPSLIKELQAKLVLPSSPSLLSPSSSSTTTTTTTIAPPKSDATMEKDHQKQEKKEKDTAFYYSFNPTLSAEMSSYKRYEYFRLLRHLYVFRGDVVVLLGHVSSAAIPLCQWLLYSTTTPASSTPCTTTTTPPCSFSRCKAADADSEKTNEFLPTMAPPSCAPLASSCTTKEEGEKEEKKEGRNTDNDVEYRVATQLQASLQYHFELEHTYLDFPIPSKTLLLTTDAREGEEKEHEKAEKPHDRVSSVTSSPSRYKAEEWVSLMHHALDHEASRDARKAAISTPHGETGERMRKTHPLYWISSSTYELPCTEKAIAEFSFFS